jgi:hypothetical protein
VSVLRYEAKTSGVSSLRWRSARCDRRVSGRRGGGDVEVDRAESACRLGEPFAQSKRFDHLDVGADGERSWENNWLNDMTRTGSDEQ